MSVAVAALTVAIPSAFAGIPNVAVVTYPVRGDSVEAIRASLYGAERHDPNDDERVEALTHWRFRWRWPGTAGGDCLLSAASVRFAATVTLPRLVGLATLPPDIQERWRRYRAALEAHEANHVRHAYRHRGDVIAAIRGATCATAEAAGRAAVARLVEHDLAYDRDTRHGASEGVVF